MNKRPQSFAIAWGRRKPSAERLASLMFLTTALCLAAPAPGDLYASKARASSSASEHRPIKITTTVFDPAKIPLEAFGD